jgi:hypothetical protein
MITAFALLAVSVSQPAAHAPKKKMPFGHFVAMYLPESVTLPEHTAQWITIERHTQVKAFQLLFLAYNDKNVRTAFAKKYAPVCTKAISCNDALRTFYDTLDVKTVESHPKIDFLLALFTLSNDAWQSELRSSSGRVGFQRMYLFDGKKRTYLPDFITFNRQSFAHELHGDQLPIRSLSARSKEGKLAASHLWKKTCNKEQSIGIKINPDPIKKSFKELSDAPNCPDACSIL